MYKVWDKKDIRKVLLGAGKKHKHSAKDIPIIISSRMTRTMASFNFIQSKNGIKAHSFKFSKNLLDGNFKESVVENVILHEYAHFYINTKTNKDQKHGELFKDTCKMIGIPTETYFQEKLIETAKKGYILYCKECDAKVATRRRIDSTLMICRDKISNCCSAEIYYKEDIF